MNRAPVAALLLSVAVLAACGRAEPGIAPGGAAGVSDPLPGSEYVATSVTGHDLVPGTAIRVRFTDDGRVLADAGCNSISGQARIDGGVLTVDGDGLATTDMGCDPPRHAQDEWLARFLASKPTASLDGDTLVLRSGDTEIELLDREVAQPDVALEGTPWTIDTLTAGGPDGADGTASSMPAGTAATLTFDDGTVEVDTGCNTGTAPYQVDGATITFGPTVLTRRGCPPEVEPVERAIVAVLAGPVEFDVDANRLTLRGDGSGLGATTG